MPPGMIIGDFADYWKLEVMRVPAQLTITLAALAALMLINANAALSAEPLGRRANRVVGLSFNEPKQTEFLKGVLKSLDLRYTATVTPEGELVEWASTDVAQEQEIQNRVSQFWFILTQCSGMRPPLPSQPARATLSCSK